MESIGETDKDYHTSTDVTPSETPTSHVQPSDKQLDGTSTFMNCPKPSRKASWVWEHFVKIKSENKLEQKVVCNYCQITISCLTSNGTSGMSNHLGRCKKYPFNADKRQKTLEAIGQSNKKDDGKSTISPYSFNQATCRKALARMIIVDELPFKFVEREGLRDYSKYMQPRFIIPSRSTITRDCYKLFLEKKKELKSIFSKLSSRLYLTTDTWTSCQNLSYMCLTTHFIDDDWHLHKKIINFCHISSHAGLMIGRAVETCLLEWGIDKVLIVTVDNASSNDVGIAHLQKRLNNWKGSILQAKHLHMRCAAHILSLIVNEGLKEIDESIGRIRSAIKYVRSSPARWQRFKACVDKEKIKYHSNVCLDVETRWNSTYLMLETAIKFQKAFELLDAQDSKFSEELLVKKGISLESDWEYARGLLPFLKVFYEATLRLSGSLYSTDNLYVKEIYGLRMIISKYCNSDNASLKLMALNMKAKHDKYWANIDKINEMIFIAIIFDPRYKLKYVTWVINESYPKEDVMKLEDRVKTTLASMYEFYASSQPQTNSESNNVEQGSQMEIEDLLACRDYMDIMYKEQVGGQEAIEKKSELDKYLQEDCEESTNKSFTILLWWKINVLRYHVCSLIAKDVLAIQVFTVASESAFSTSGCVLDSFRSSLTLKMVEALICGQDWLRTSHNPIYIEKVLDEFEKIESELSTMNEA